MGTADSERLQSVREAGQLRSMLTDATSSLRCGNVRGTGSLRVGNRRCVWRADGERRGNNLSTDVLGADENL